MIRDLWAPVVIPWGTVLLLVCMTVPFRTGLDQWKGRVSRFVVQLFVYPAVAIPVNGLSIWLVGTAMPPYALIACFLLSWYFAGLLAGRLAEGGRDEPTPGGSGQGDGSCTQPSAPDKPKIQ